VYRSRKILIVEPNNKEAKELLSLFADEDYDLEISRNFAEAAERVKDIKFDCVTMDVNLPDMKGYEAVSILKKIDPKIQVIMTADQNSIELEAKVREQDIFYYYIKSFDRCELKLAVRGVFEKLGKAKEARKMDKPANILIDDDEAIRDACCQALSRDGYRIETAEDGDTGLQKIREIKPGIALIDLKMPGMSGMELLEKARYIDSNIVAVVITGYATIESALEAMKQNAYDFLPKPFTPDQLRAVTRRGLEKRRLTLESARLQQGKEKIRENFIALVSHQLRSPLVSIQQNLGLFLGGFAGEVTSKQKEMLESVNNRIDELIKIIHNRLTISCIKSGKIVEKFEPVSLVPILSEAIELLRPLAERNKINQKMDSPDSLPIIRGNREALKQAFTNLISNGINYNKEGGTLAIRVRGEENDFVIEISDTGMGISPEKLPFIFDEFFRVKTRETQGITGSGLGLPIAKSIIEAHNGSIKVESEPGKGTTFSVLLPKIEIKQ